MKEVDGEIEMMNDEYPADPQGKRIGEKWIIIKQDRRKDRPRARKEERKGKRTVKRANSGSDVAKKSKTV